MSSNVYVGVWLDAVFIDHGEPLARFLRSATLAHPVRRTGNEKL